MEKNVNVYKRAFMDTVPVMAGYLVLGIGFGMVLTSKGYSVFLAFLMSLFIYAGSMQYVTISLLTSGASFITSALTTLMVNCRHLFYGISMIDRYKNTGKTKPYLIFALTDETYSLVCTDKEDLNREEMNSYYFLVSLFDQCYWVSGSVIGAVAGSLLSINTEGVDFSLTALFISIFVDQWITNKDHRPALLGVGISAVCLMLFGGDNFLIPSMILIAASLLLMRKTGGNR